MEGEEKLRALESRAERILHLLQLPFHSNPPPTWETLLERYYIMLLQLAGLLDSIDDTLGKLSIYPVNLSSDPQATTAIPYLLLAKPLNDINEEEKEICSTCTETDEFKHSIDPNELETQLEEAIEDFNNIRNYIVKDFEQQKSAVDLKKQGNVVMNAGSYQSTLQMVSATLFGNALRVEQPKKEQTKPNSANSRVNTSIKKNFNTTNNKNNSNNNNNNNIRNKIATRPPNNGTSLAPGANASKMRANINRTRAAINANRSVNRVVSAVGTRPNMSTTHPMPSMVSTQNAALLTNSGSYPTNRTQHMIQQIHPSMYSSTGTSQQPFVTRSNSLFAQPQSTYANYNNALMQPRYPNPAHHTSNNNNNNNMQL